MRRDRARFVLIVAVATAALLGTSSCATDDTHATATTAAPTSTKGVARLTVEVLERHPHDTAAFTEGLTFGEDGRLYESLGLDGQSSIREVDPETGKVVRENELAADQFGEGITIRAGVIHQLTWKNGVLRTWNADTLEPGSDLTYRGEGWGLTFDGTSFVQSDGSSRLIVRREDSFDPPTRSIDVTRDGAPVDQLNELEWVDGVIYANVWHSDEIMRIDPRTGRVTGVIDASELWRDRARTTEMTLNGIAHRPGEPADRLWLTGKNWPEMFEVKVVPS